MFLGTVLAHLGNENFHGFWLENKQWTTVTPWQLQAFTIKHTQLTYSHTQGNWLHWCQCRCKLLSRKGLSKVHFFCNKLMHRCNQLTLRLELTTTPKSHTNNRMTISECFMAFYRRWSQADVSSERTCSRKWKDFKRTSFPRQPSLGLRLIISTGWSQCYSSLGFGQLWSHSHLKASSWPPMIS